MTMPKTHTTCKNCGTEFERLFAHQIFCNMACAFWSRVQRGNDCWLWTGSTASNGYGEFGYNGAVIRTHVFSYEHHFGPTPQSILHTCDIRNCVNPFHLYAGTQDDNMADVIMRGRGLKKLTPENVEELRNTIRAGKPLYPLSLKFKVAPAGLYAMRNRLKRRGLL